MELIKYLKDRGIINNISDEKKLQNAIENKMGVYIGFDPSFKSLHLGNYIMIHLLNTFAKAGVPTFALIGGATGRIGDPSGKKAERTLLDVSVVESNIASLSIQLKTLTKAEVVNNWDFYKENTLMDFLRDVGKYINVNYMLEKEIISSRLEAGISFAEFTYNLIQGYDFLHLYDIKNIGIQCGGADQWGNITTGLELIRKYHGEDAKAVGMTINLLLKSDGTKFGKSEKGAIYLDPEVTSPYEMYQFILNQADADLERMFNFFSDLSSEEIKTLLAKHNENKGARLGQKTLAEELVTTIHGAEAYNQCIRITDALFKNQFETLSEKELAAAAKSMNVISIDRDTDIGQFLINNSIVESKRVLRELIQAKTLLVNGQPVIQEKMILSRKETYFNKYTIIKKGKKNYYMIAWVD